VTGFEAGLPETGDVTLLGEALTLLAATQLGLKDEAGARASFAQLLRIRPTFAMDVNTYGPKVARVFEKARVEAALKPRASLKVTCDPEARVLLDGHARGKTPLELDDIPTGRHALRLDAEGYEPWWGMVDVGVSGSAYPLHLNALAPAKPPVAQFDPPATVVSSPPGPAPAPPPPAARLHAYAAPFVDLLNHAAGGEIGAALTLIPQLDLVASASLGRHVGAQAGVALGFSRGENAVRPFLVLRGIAVPVPGGVAWGGAAWLGASLEAGPGRLLAGASAEVYSAPQGYDATGVLALVGYELDIL